MDAGSRAAWSADGRELFYVSSNPAKTLAALWTSEDHWGPSLSASRDEWTDAACLRGAP